MSSAGVRRTFFLRLAVLWLASLQSVIPAFSQTDYRLPPQEIIDILDQPPTPEVTIGPRRQWMVLVHRSGMPTIGQLSEPILRLAGRRFNPRTSGPVPERRGEVTDFTIKRISDGSERRMDLPEEARLSFPLWAPDGAHFAFTHTTGTGIELWVAETASGRTRRLTPPRLNATAGNPCRWAPDSRRLLCSMIPESRGEEPQASAVPNGPLIQESRGVTAPVRTFQDLLQDHSDILLWEHYRRSQLAWIDSTDGSLRKAGSAAIFEDVSISPDGQYLLVEQIVPPYSFLVPESYFAKKVEVWSQDGRVVFELARLPLAETVPTGGVRTGPRSYQWRASAPSTLIWVEALDDGDPKRKVDHRDRLMNLPSAFETEPEEFGRTISRYSGIEWGSEGLALVHDYERRQQWSRTSLLSVDEKVDPKLLWEHSRFDGYSDPGSALLRTDPNGHRVMVQDGDWIFLSGRGASPRGDHPFLDQYNLRTSEKKRLFQCDEGTYETVVGMLDDQGGRILTRFETTTHPPNYFLRDLQQQTRRALTVFPDPAPQLRGITQQLITYEREDGVQLSGQLYLPAGYRSGERLPMVMWAYPREYNDPNVAGQVRGSPHRFSTFTGPSHLFFLTQGYALLDGPAMPVVGEQGNDNFVQQLVMNAKAAVDKVVEMGVADRSRIGIGGHSYGAFMTANLLAHSDLFQAGIARSGAYNRSLTPFGFQNEQRSFWEAPEVYFAMSPFMHAQKVNEPILLIHGAADNNSGTFPLQSQRYYHAIKGLGGKVRLVMLPHESHGYSARESVLHVLAEMIDWFNRYVKEAGSGEEHLDSRSSQATRKFKIRSRSSETVAKSQILNLPRRTQRARRPLGGNEAAR